MSKQKSVREILDELVEETVPKLMQAIMDEEDVAAEVKAARISLANTTLHHLRLLRGAYE